MLNHIYHHFMFIMLMNVFMQVNAQNVNITQDIHNVNVSLQQCWSGVEYEKWNALQYCALSGCLITIIVALLCGSGRSKNSTKRSKKLSDSESSIRSRIRKFDANYYQPKADKQSIKKSNVRGDVYGYPESKLSYDNSEQQAFSKVSHSEQDYDEDSDDSDSSDDQKRTSGTLKGARHLSASARNLSTGSRYLAVRFSPSNRSSVDSHSQSQSINSGHQRFSKIRNFAKSVKRKLSHNNPENTNKDYDEDFDDQSSYDVQGKSSQRNSATDIVKGTFTSAYGVTRGVVKKLANAGSDKESNINSKSASKSISKSTSMKSEDTDIQRFAETRESAQRKTQSVEKKRGTLNPFSVVRNLFSRVFSPDAFCPRK